MNEVLAKRLLGACVLVGATLVLARLLPSPQSVPPPEDQAKRVTYDMRPAIEVAKIEPPPAPEPAAAVEDEPETKAPTETAPASAPIEKPAPAPVEKPAPAMPKAAPVVKAVPKPKPQPQKPAQVASAPTASTQAAPAPADSTPPASAPVAPAPPATAVPKGAWYLQIGVFAVEANAAKSVAKLREAGLQTLQGTIAVKAGKAYRVRCGPFATPEEANQGKAKAAAIGFKDARVTHE